MTDMRFAFGKNWKNYLQHLSSARVQSARESLSSILAAESLAGLRMLDIGCGSGLFSLAALQLDAAEVVSFDYDADSVACANSLNAKFGPYRNWIISQGSVLDKDWMARLGKFDVVYSWGVLHHTGSMWAALDVICIAVKNNGILCISIYNDQGIVSNIWAIVKRLYNLAPSWIRFVMVAGYTIPASIWMVAKGIVRRRPIREWFPAITARGMHYYYDVVDWLGGYPFEVAKPQAIIQFYRDRGFSLIDARIRKGSGCNEFVFRRIENNGCTPR